MSRCITITSLETETCNFKMTDVYTVYIHTGIYTYIYSTVALSKESPSLCRLCYSRAQILTQMTIDEIVPERKQVSR